MGLSASQARLLSITARLSDNELHSQQIANSKVRLADKTQEASQEYLDSLNATKLVFTTYNSDGGTIQNPLTAGLMYQYADMKNQYGISNTSGQLLVSATDAMNFENSANVNEFVSMYGVELTDNPKYTAALETLYGQDYNLFYNTADNTVNDGLNNFANGVKGWVGGWNTGMTQQQYDAWKSQSDWIDGYIGQASGLYGELLNKLKDIPISPADKPTPPTKPTMPTMPDMPDFAALAAAYNGSACYKDVNNNTGNTRVWHIEHNLCHLIWGPGGFGTDSNGSKKTITNSDGTISITPTGTLGNNSLTTGFGGSGKDAATTLLNGFKENNVLEEYDCVKEVVQSLIDLYCDVINYLSNAGYSINSSAFTISSVEASKSANELYTQWQQFYTDLANLEDAGAKEYEDKRAEWQEEYDKQMEIYNKEYEEYEKELEEYKEALLDGAAWQQACNELYDQYQEAIANLPTPEIPDPEDPKTEWYTNLWHRMNGTSDDKSTEGKNGTYYKQLDDNLLNSDTWLQFALEHGVVMLEQVRFVEEAEDDTGLEYSKWTATTYGSCSDITEVEDEVAIARAEAEYTKKLNEIEAKDKKYDNDIKKLDTEHNALQTEYDSVKSVIEKNVERSFKAFS